MHLECIHPEQVSQATQSYIHIIFQKSRCALNRILVSHPQTPPPPPSVIMTLTVGKMICESPLRSPPQGARHRNQDYILSVVPKERAPPPPPPHPHPFKFATIYAASMHASHMNNVKTLTYSCCLQSNNHQHNKYYSQDTRQSNYQRKTHSRDFFKGDNPSWRRTNHPRIHCPPDIIS